jgi:hypothetical protein
MAEVCTPKASLLSPSAFSTHFFFAASAGRGGEAIRSVAICTAVAKASFIA